MAPSGSDPPGTQPIDTPFHYLSDTRRRFHFDWIRTHERCRAHRLDRLTHSVPTLEATMPYAIVFEDDNSGEDPDDGRRALREELFPTIKLLEEIKFGLFLTAYDCGRSI